MDDYESRRRRMVDAQLRRRGVRDERVLAAFEQVPRHLFVPEDERNDAYADTPLPIGYGQTISQPYIVAVMLSLLALRGGERVLEIGTGSGYEAALLGTLSGEVHTVELVPALAREAARLLGEMRHDNVHVHIADGSLGWQDAAPYAGIIAAAAAPRVPPPLMEQLADGGHLVLPVASGHEQYLRAITRSQGEFRERIVAAVAFVPMHGKHGWD